MKTLLITLIIFAFPMFALSQTQDSTEQNTSGFEELILEENAPDKFTLDQDSSKTNVEKSKENVQIRVGKHNIEVITEDSRTSIDIEKIDDFNSRWKNDNQSNNHYSKEVRTINRRPKRRFNGHWKGIEFGGNQLWETDYSMYPEGTPKFIETMPEKSFEFNFNFAEYSFGFGSYAGIVTGLGFNFNDYKFKNRYTMKMVDGMMQPVALPDGDFKLSKLSTTYLTAPLLFEIQIPGNHGADHLFISGGVIGGLKLGDRTKTKIGNEKLKDKGDQGVAPLRWGYTARVGFQNMGVFATYYNVSLFRDGVGPTTTPLTVGLTLSF